MTYRPLVRAAAVATIALASVTVAEAGRRPMQAASAQASKAAMSDQECMARAMYFESNRNHADGMLAVGTIVANRLASGRYASTICGVVGQNAQFAPGVLTRRMTEAKPAERARRVAETVLAGARHPTAGDAMFFHTANVPFRNDDKAYVLVSGGNAFYRWNRDREEARENLETLTKAVAAKEDTKETGERAVEKAMVAGSDLPVLTPDVVAIPEPASASAPELKLALLAAAEPAALAQVSPTTVAAKDAEIVEARVATEIVAAPNGLSRALACRGEPSRAPASSDAVAALMALSFHPQERRPETPRVITPAAPVYASAAPIFKSRTTPAANPMANIVVAQAWSAFD